MKFLKAIKIAAICLGLCLIPIIAYSTFQNPGGIFNTFKYALRGVTTKTMIINAATASDDFLLWRTPVTIHITDIYGVLQSGTNVVGGLDECDENGANCVAVDADITFDGSLDQDDGSLSNGTIDAGDWIRWHTTSVNAPGFLAVTINFRIP